ncbi:hypothetical protein IOQ59_10955 [Pontibacterium sp. N1Y112]|uniref:Uncharacterized protein n=1 Tax=Pontibacterium sinense TaxID=2781979 RepID=A0A8J7FDN9_9GAMM|nr:hypothetical protein [Pontibacterium sinense]MBE9397776.1 hypothetical protein [Pontibacterium sinense]
MMDLIVGIDPGLKGAISFMKASTGEILDLDDMPIKKVALISGKKKIKVCALQLAALFSKWFGEFGDEMMYRLSRLFWSVSIYRVPKVMQVHLETNKDQLDTQMHEVA